MKRQLKYRNKPVEVDGIRFASKAEARRYGELKLLERAGEIADLRLQPPFRLDVNGLHIADYRGDFAYRNVRTGMAGVEDVKGVRTDSYRLKRLLMKACHGVDIVEVAV